MIEAYNFVCFARSKAPALECSILVIKLEC